MGEWYCNGTSSLQSIERNRSLHWKRMAERRQPRPMVWIFCTRWAYDRVENRGGLVVLSQQHLSINQQQAEPKGQLPGRATANQICWGDREKASENRLWPSCWRKIIVRMNRLKQGSTSQSFRTICYESQKRNEDNSLHHWFNFIQFPVLFVLTYL